MRYSHSRIQCFEKCPLSFRYRYIDRAPQDFKNTIEAYMGSSVHSALEMLYNRLLTGQKPEKENLLSYYDHLWHKGLSEDIHIVNQDKDAKDYHEIGRMCIDSYYESHSPFEEVKTIMCEKKVNVDLLGDGNYKLVGFIDRVDMVSEGFYEVHDYKTSKTMPSQNKMDKDRQLSIYELGLRQSIDDVIDVGFIWHFLAHNKRLDAKNTPEALEAKTMSLIQSIHRIEEAVVEDFFPKVWTPRCRWCEFKSLCENSSQIIQKQSRLSNFS